jgi:hypothetical protein
MIVPASAVGFVFSGALINVQALESVAFFLSADIRVLSPCISRVIELLLPSR